jgi:hypothetical protein
MKKSKEQRKREREIIDEYYDKRMRQLLEPLYEDFQKWKRGELSHYELLERIHQVHKENQKLYRLFTSSREFLLKVIDFEAEMERKQTSATEEKTFLDNEKNTQGKI